MTITAMAVYPIGEPNMRYLLLVLSMLLYPATSAYAQISIGIGISLPGIDIGINLPAYPRLVRVPGYPVYYAPQADVNIFFYDGLYWVYEEDRWYASSWYNGPWDEVEPEYVPVFVLRVPVRYYRRPPVYFRYWRADRPPRWGEHWGPDWERRHGGWDRWDNRSAPPPAPLPIYQQQYSGDRYPRSVEQQHTIRSQNYRYQPREPITQQHFQQRNQQQQEQQQQNQQRQQQEPQRQQQQQNQERQQQEPQRQQQEQQRQQQQQNQERQQQEQQRQRQKPQQQQQEQQRQQQQQNQERQQQEQQRQQQDNPNRSRAGQRQQAPDVQQSPTQQRQKEQLKKLPPNMQPPETEQQDRGGGSKN